MITTYRRSRLNDPENTLETLIADNEPPLDLMLREMEQARTDVQWYLRRNEQAHNWAHSRWDDQTIDGRKHGENPFPWEGSADARLRTVATIIGEHVTLMKWAYLNAKVQATALRPVTNGRKSKKASILLRWVIYTQLREELQLELPLAWWWKYCYGAALLKVEWEQSRRLEMMPLSMDDLTQMVAMRAQSPSSPGGPPIGPASLLDVGQDAGAPGDDVAAMNAVLKAIMDPEQEEQVAILIQSFSNILSKAEARTIVRNLREKGKAQIPIPRLYRNQPKITALRPGVEVLFPIEMDRPQSAGTRWMAEYEYPTETQLRDRILTDNYDPKFVEEALKHKGKVSNPEWLTRTMQERSTFSDHYAGGIGSGENAFRDKVELVHFYGYAIHFKTPCLYHTIFSPHVKPVAGSKSALYASHQPYEFDHGQMPFIAMRRQVRARSLLSSIGIAEEAYTDEQELKAQEDGVTDRTSLVVKPPMTVPTTRVNAIANEMAPGKVLGVTRANEIGWLTPPPFDETPFQMMEKVVQRLDRRYAIFGGEELDPDLKQMRREEVSNDGLIEVELMNGQIFMLEQQYMTDDEAQAVVGPLAGPFHVSKQEIQGQHEVVVKVDVRMLDDDYAQKKLQLVQEGLQLNQGGTANMNKLFEWWMNEVDPDLADVAVQDEQTATDKEKQDELVAVGQIMNGIDQPFPMQGNMQLRLQALLGATVNSPNPSMKGRLELAKDSQLMLENRIKFFQNQIQQRQVNPQIGRMLTKNTFAPNQAPEAAGPMQ